MSIPRVTVLMSVYNGAAFLPAALRSILGQSLNDFELLVIDDGSTDRSVEIMRSYEDERIRVVCNKMNLGQTASLNRGLGLARGEYIARQDADDVSETKRLELQVEYLDKNESVAVVGCQAIKIDPDGVVIGIYKAPVRSVDLHWKLLFQNPIIHSAAMMRRSVVWKEFGGYDLRYSYAQDYDLWSRVATRHRLANLPESLVRYRVHEGQMWLTCGEPSSREPPEISCRNVSRLIPNVSEQEVEALHVMGRGIRAYPGSVEIRRTVQCFESLLQAHVARFHCEMASSRKTRRWSHRVRRDAMLSLVDPAIFSNECRRNAATALFTLWRGDWSAIWVSGHSVLKLLVGCRFRFLAKLFFRRRSNTQFCGGSN